MRNKTGKYTFNSNNGEGQSNGEHPSETEDVPYFLTCRFSLAVISFIGFMFVYLVRINFSIAMVCMLKYPMLTDSTDGLNTTVPIDTEDKCNLVAGETAQHQGEFEWPRTMQGYMLSSFYIGYILTQLPGGVIADKFGGKAVFGGGMLTTVIATMVIPVGARFHYSLVFVCRVFTGLGSGVVFPAMHSIWGKWAPPLERSKLMAFSYSGPMVGNVVALTTSGLICATEIDGGWPLIFYSAGGATLLWLILWVFFVFDSPRDHPRISEKERDYIERAIGKFSNRKKHLKIPWFSILTSPAFIAILIAHVCSTWGMNTLHTSLPLYMKDVLQFDIKSNGILSALPYICMWVSAIVSGQIADALRRNYILSTEWTRKIFQLVGFVGPAIFVIIIGHMDCDRRTLAVVFLTIGVTLAGASTSAFNVNHVDIAPRFAGVLFGITNTAATLPGIFAPMAVGEITVHGTAEEWRIVFFIFAGIYFFGAIVFTIFAKGEEMEWAKLPDVDSERNDKIPVDNKAMDIFDGDITCKPPEVD